MPRKLYFIALHLIVTEHPSVLFGSCQNWLGFFFLFNVSVHKAVTVYFIKVAFFSTLSAVQFVTSQVRYCCMKGMFLERYYICRLKGVHPLLIANCIPSAAIQNMKKKIKPI